MMSLFNTPVLFLVFNRPDTTTLVFEQIRAVKPKYLFVAADGPRLHKEGEAELCQQVREIAITIDWDCELKTLFREQNLGCGKAVSEAINWFFKEVEEGIILEDDCLPDQSFFHFASTMLQRYKANNRIMHIAGVNFQNGEIRGDGDYYFSKYPHVWGWATWRRAWSKYDYNLLGLQKFQWQFFRNYIFNSNEEKAFWLNTWRYMQEGKIDTWDYQWVFTVMSNRGYCIIPNQNLISNIGFGSDATHTVEESPFSNIAVSTLVNYREPSSLKINKTADQFTANVFGFSLRNTFTGSTSQLSLLSKVFRKVKLIKQKLF